MKITTLVWSEITHRKLGFMIALVAVLVAVAASVCVVTMVRAQQLHTNQQVEALNDEIRKITKNMGFNIMIFPRSLKLGDFHASDFADATMPQEYVDRLAESPDVVTINHLRPALIRKVDWPEQRRQILLMGVTGVVPFKHRVNKKPLSEPVPPGSMRIGSVLAEELQLKEGQQLTFQDRTFQVAKVVPPQGNKDDITVWIDLATAQEMLQLPGQINMIQALECNCASLDRLAEIDREISGLLGGDVRVVEMGNIALARAKSRNEVAAAGQRAAQSMERLAMILIPLAIVASGASVCLLAWANVRERRGEIGILRAIGVRSRQILAVFLGKAMVIGLLGAMVGFGVGFALAWSADRLKEKDLVGPLEASELFQPAVLVTVLVLTPLLAILASWLPALMAATQDPAEVLREE